MLAAISPSQASFHSLGQLQAETAPIAQEVKFRKHKRSVRVRDFRKKIDRARARPGKNLRKKERTRVRDFRPDRPRRVGARPGR
jgi:hypothetical protein